MAILKPFKGLRPPKKLAVEIASLPYDVMSTSEARKMGKNNEKSFLHITRPEIDFSSNVNIHSQKVYQKAVTNLKKFIQKGWLVQDDMTKFYIYAQTMNRHTQYGIVGCAACKDYENGVIKKHELTMPTKEDDRMKIILGTNANIEPVFFSYPAVTEIDTLVNMIISLQLPIYDFIATDGIKHQFWCVNDTETNTQIEKLFLERVPYTYVADGHHRSAATARVGLEKKAKNPNHTGKEEYNFFMAVHFPDNQLKILDYNRIVKDLNGNTPENFLEKLKLIFDITCHNDAIFKPKKLHEFSMYLNGKWYQLLAKNYTTEDTDIISTLDVTILSKYVLEPILNIKDLRTSKRIDFVGGIRGLSTLKAQVDSESYAVAFALYPVSMQQLIAVADAGKIMPPKVTWFEPKLRSGLIIHLL